MVRSFAVAAGVALALAAAAQQPPPAAPAQTPTTPPPGNDQSLRQLSPDEIPPNLSFYAMDPLYKPGVPLGWSATEIRERLDRGLVAIAAEGGRVHLSWRLLQSDEPGVAFNVYRGAGSSAVRLNAKPLQATTDYVRGTYGLMKVDAWMLRQGKLQKVWRWTNERAPFKYHGQGQHSIKVADIDGDGADEILNGSIAVDNDGRTLWSTGLGHGDRFYVSDIDPARPGLEVWYTVEDPHPQNGVSLWDALKGTLIFGSTEPSLDNQIAGGLVGDIDPGFAGMEVWGDKYFYTAQGTRIEGPVPPQNELVWWDADLLREIHSRGAISKWKGAELGRTEGSVQHVADITGDWREEIVTFVNGQLRIHGTSIPATDRRVTLMQDRLYRNDVTHRSMGYPHVPMTSYYLGVATPRQ